MLEHFGPAPTEGRAQAAASASSLQMYITRWAAGAGHVRALPGLPPLPGPTTSTLSQWRSAATEDAAQAAPCASSSHTYVATWAAGGRRARALPRLPPLFAGGTPACAACGLAADHLGGTPPAGGPRFAPHPQRCSRGGPASKMRLCKVSHAPCIWSNRIIFRLMLLWPAGQAFLWKMDKMMT